MMKKEDLIECLEIITDNLSSGRNMYDGISVIDLNNLEPEGYPKCSPEIAESLIDYNAYCDKDYDIESVMKKLKSKGIWVFREGKYSVAPNYIYLDEILLK